MSEITIYTLRNCDTCRKAVKWLERHAIGFVEKPIRETPPSLGELKTMRAAYGGELRRLFNTAGGDYRELKLGEKLPLMTEAEALGLLAQNGNLVKRPFAVGRGVALVGWDESIWSAALAKK